MKYQIDYSEISRLKGFEQFYQEVSGKDSFDSEESFNAYCKEIIAVWNEIFIDKSGLAGSTKVEERFSEYFSKIKAEPEKSISTGWGGVYIVENRGTHIEKYLIVQAGKYLSLEKHAEKEEELNVIEGAGFLLYRGLGQDFLTAKILIPQVKVEFKPGQEHCIIATENLLIYERSEDYKGMDQDLIFIFNPLV